jgi:hypothetical protein
MSVSAGGIGKIQKAANSCTAPNMVCRVNEHEYFLQIHALHQIWFAE